MKATVRIKKRFQVTIPESIREAFDLDEGDFLEIDVLPIKNNIYWRQDKP